MEPPTASSPHAANRALSEALDRDPTVAVVTDGALHGLPEHRVTVVPVADRGALGFALGMALARKRVVVDLAHTGRLPAVLEVLVEAGAIAGAGEYAPSLVVRVPYGDEAQGIDAPVGPWLAHLRGVRVVCPSSPEDAAALLAWAIGAGGPVVVLEPRAGASGRAPTVGSPGSAHLARTGAHATVAAWGAGVVTAALAAAEALAAEGVDVDVLDLVSLAPLDRSALGARVRATGRLVVAHPNDPAMAARIREVAVDEAFLYLEAPIGDAVVGGPGGAAAIARAVRSAVHW